MTKDTIYLIDGSAYIYRAYHAIPPLNNSSGLPTHAILGFTNILRRIIRERSPKMLAVAWDTKGPVFRHRIYKDYKANRPSMPEDLSVQIPYIKNIVSAFNISSLETGDLEADDLIASATARYSAAGYPIIIVSGDKDLIQLVSDNVSLWEPMADKIYTPETVVEKYGIPPTHFLDYLSLTGDSSDNIPGVPGVGPKTAQKLISQWNNLETLYEKGIDTMNPSKMKEKLISNKDNAFLSRELIRLDSKAELPDDPSFFAIQTSDNDKLRHLLTELEFFSILKEEVSADQVNTRGFILVDNQMGFETMLNELSGCLHLVIDTETTSLNTLEAGLVGISLCVSTEKAWYLPLDHQDEDGQRLPNQLDTATVLAGLAPFLADETLPKIGHNLKYDLAVLASSVNGATMVYGPLYDTMIGAWLLDPARRSYKLDDLGRELNLELTSFEKVTQGDKRDDAFCRVDPWAAKDYSCEDVYTTLLLFEQQQPLLVERNLWDLFAKVEGPLIKVLMTMEQHGILVNRDLLKELSHEFGERLLEMEKDIYRLAGKEFNINSPKQLGVILFEDLHLPTGKKTKTGFSTDIKVLENLSRHHELPRHIVSYRNIAKLKSTYVDALGVLLRPDSSRVHTSFNQCGTATGRLSSSNPNLQNIPIRTEEGRRIRGAFIAAPSHCLMSADYSQIDLRVLAHYSKDQALIKAFRSGEDVHRRTASEIFRVSPLLVTPEMRRVAKTINFGIVYGMSSFGLASQLDLSRKEAQTFIDRYFDLYGGVKMFMETIIEQARRDGFVTTLFGRRRLLPEINSANKNRREFAERTAINTPIQGTAADIIKLAMLDIDRKLRDNGFESKLLLQIHDELVLEVPLGEEAQISELVRNCMENVANLLVPLIVNVSSGKSLDKN
ncbi:MAG: DNA polymerase I [Desulfobulbaceae bacterium]|nr:DNA polymerase I [Desulfobulbaceae bacterium]